MATISIQDRTGKEVGKYEVEPTDFAPRINKKLLHDAVVMYQANLRQGSQKTKSRGQVSGTGKKLFKQKGTGNARAGSKRSGTRRGGGHIFALDNRDHSYSLPRKALQLATRMAIASKIKDNEVVLIDELAFEAPKTKEMAGVLKNLGFDSGTLLLTTVDYDVNIYKSARNIDKASVSPVSELNALSVLSADTLVLTREAMDVLKEKAQSRKKA